MAYDRPSDDVNSADSGIHGGGESPALRLLIQVDKHIQKYFSGTPVLAGVLRILCM